MANPTGDPKKHTVEVELIENAGLYMTMEGGVATLPDPDGRVFEFSPILGGGLFIRSESTGKWYAIEARTLVQAVINFEDSKTDSPVPDLPEAKEGEANG